jgi:two-component system NarL family response regulator
MRNSPPIRLLIADEHALVRVGLASVLANETDIKIIAEASGGSEAVSLFRKHQPDVAFFDVRMPVIGGIAALRTVRQEFPDACVLMISTFELDEEVAESMVAGARGFLLKSHDPSLRATAIRSANAGDPQFSSAVLARLAARVPLAPREIEVLRGIARGLSNKEIAAQLHLSPHTVKTYVKGLLTKLDATDRAGAVTAGYESGFLKIQKGQS